MKNNYDSEIMNLTPAELNMIFMRRRKILEKHEFEIYKGTDGKWRTYLPDDTKKSKRRLVKRNTRQEVEDVIVAYYREPIDYSNTVFSICEMWLERKLDMHDIEKQTYDRYYTDAIRYFKNSNISQYEISEITEEYLEEFIKDMIYEYGMKYKQWSNLRTLIIGVFKFAYKRKLTDISIKDFLNSLELSRKAFNRERVDHKTQVFNTEERSKIIDFIDNDTENITDLGIKLCFYTGLRIGELSTLKQSDVHEDRISVRRTEVRYKDENEKFVFEVREFPKSEAGIRDVILVPEAQEIIKKIIRLNPFSEFLFMKNGNRIRSVYFSNRMYRICDKLGIPRKSMHKARKTYGTNLLNSDVDRQIIIQQMGHTDISTTEKYYYYNDKSETEIKKQLLAALS